MEVTSSTGLSLVILRTLRRELVSTTLIKVQRCTDAPVNGRVSGHLEGQVIRWLSFGLESGTSSTFFACPCLLSSQTQRNVFAARRSRAPRRETIHQKATKNGSQNQYRDCLNKGP